MVCPQRKNFVLFIRGIKDLFGLYELRLHSVLHMVRFDLPPDLIIPVLRGIETHRAVFMTERVGQKQQIGGAEMVAVAVGDQAVADLFPFDAVLQRMADGICVIIEQQLSVHERL